MVSTRRREKEVLGRGRAGQVSEEDRIEHPEGIFAGEIGFRSNWWFRVSLGNRLLDRGMAELANLAVPLR